MISLLQLLLEGDSLGRKKKYSYWSSNTEYKEDTTILPTFYDSMDEKRQYTATSSGKSGSTEPAWGTNVGTLYKDGTLEWRCENTEWQQRSGGFMVTKKDLEFGTRNPDIAEYFYKKARNADSESTVLYNLYRAVGHTKQGAKALVSDYFQREIDTAKRIGGEHGAYIPLSMLGDESNINDLEGRFDLRKYSALVTYNNIPDKILGVALIKDFVLYLKAQSKNNPICLKVFAWMSIAGEFDQDLETPSDVIPFYSELKSVINDVSQELTKKDPAKTEYKIYAKLKIGVNTWNDWKDFIRKTIVNYYDENDMDLPFKEETEKIAKNNKISIPYVLTASKIKPEEVFLVLMAIIQIVKVILPSEYAKLKKYGDTAAEIVSKIPPVVIKYVLEILRDKVVVKILTKMGK